MADEHLQRPDRRQPEQRAAAPRHRAVQGDDPAEPFREGQPEPVGQGRPLADAHQEDALRVDVVVATGLLDGPEEVFLQRRVVVVAAPGAAEPAFPRGKRHRPPVQVHDGG